MIKIKILTLAFLGIFTISFTALAADSNFVEPGRFGIEALVKDDGFHIGVAREADSYEGVVDLDTG